MRELVISSPAKKHAISTAVLESLARALRDAADEPILLTGAGNVFSAGLDLTEVASFDLTMPGGCLRRWRVWCRYSSTIQPPPWHS
ncbi:MAG TPA: hypothetical protein VMK12_04550 [Anaeromyxobacteraceae bacterium]|nr:hypothetical protein [Anaeromyxobacteraceae bacterium]